MGEFQKEHQDACQQPKTHSLGTNQECETYYYKHF